MKSIQWLYVVIILVVGCDCLIAQTPVNNVAPSRLTFTVDSTVVKLPYYRNFSLGANASSVHHAVIVIHGTNRDADNYYNSMLDAAFKGRSLNTAHLIMAPQFLIESDMTAYSLDPDILFWTNAGWKQGDLSLSTANFPAPAKMSSFAVIDSIVLRLARTYSNLDTIVVVGHSAGGQFVQRFAAGGPLDSVITDEYGVALRYITANPSSYVYLNGERRITGTTDQFAMPTPQQIAFCSDYDDYKYGLLKLNSYMESVGAGKIREQYKKKNVIYLLGEMDNNPNDSSLDDTPPAMFQGAYRLERGIIYVNYLKHFYGNEIANLHFRVIVPGVAHDNYAMFNSKCGVKYIFNSGACDSVTLAVEKSLPENIPNFELHQNYPNPFNSATRIDFSLFHSTSVFIKIYDVTGRQVKTLSEGNILDAGIHSITWNGTDERGNSVCSGLYFVELTCAPFRGLKRMVVLR
ncbi:MAG: FlgD immunoglobulin-like domain containing protein [Candidatus Zhuqueibacterota bacterium]